MSKIFLEAKKLLRERIKKALDCINKERLNCPDFFIEVPVNREHGELSTNVALVCARTFKTSPLDIAKKIVKNISLGGSDFDFCEIAGPGFINFKFNANFWGNILQDIVKNDAYYGRSDFGKNKKVMVEFVSANPTGPMHLGNARGGSFGDCLASVLDIAGYNVYKEFYVNDAGNQIEKFSQSLEARYLQNFLGEESVLFPEDGYKGKDITVLAKKFADIFGEKYVNVESSIRKKALIDFVLPQNIKKMKEDLKKYRIEFDNWFYESELYKNSEIEQTIKDLKAQKATYEKDGVLWAKASSFNCEKDKVLIRENGIPTYFTADIAYHRNKFLKRNFDICVNIWGADHHGHIARMKGAMDALGISSSKLEIVVVQIVKLVKNGKTVRMSKRTGETIGLIDLLEEVNVNEARFFFNILKANSQLDFDLDLAKKRASINPVYYVQYAHARICSVLRKSYFKIEDLKKLEAKDLKNLCSRSEKELIFCLASYTQEIIDASKNFDPSSVTKYVIKVATLFHKFYTTCRIENEDKSLAKARLHLCLSTKIVIKNILNMFKIDVPESM
ncbi:MAG: arginine--tRNA ligase [Oscillospiraceae bacterium]|nr:arginine--tRNA ligase [Oscillospiraceae bacterium]